MASATSSDARPAARVAGDPLCWKVLGLAALLCLAGLWAYRGSFQGEFLFDDVKPILENRGIDRFWPPSTVGKQRAVGHLALALNYRLGGHRVWGYHAFNLGVHLAAGLALFGLARRTLQLPALAGHYRQHSLFLAFAIALLWIVHPLQTESVTYVIQRLESMMGLFFLLCLYSVLRAASGSGSREASAGGTLTSSATGRSAFAWYVLAIAACWLGMATKEVMATAPLVVLLYDRAFLSGSWREVARRRWALYLAFLPALVWLALHIKPAFDPSVKSSVGLGVKGLTPWLYLSSQPGVILHYLRLVFWPEPLCLDYGWPVARTASQIYLPGAAVVGLLLASLGALRWRPGVGFLGLSFFLVLAPTSSFVPIADLAFEHRMYLPLAAVIALSVLTLHHAARLTLHSVEARRAVMVTVVLFAALLLAMRTAQRNKLYADDVAMWTETAAVAPLNPRAYVNLAISLTKKNRNVEAIAAARRALEVQPDHAMANHTLAVHLAESGEYEEAIAHYERAVQSNPKYARAYDNYGNLYARQDDFETALVRYRQAVEADLNYAPAHMHLGIALQELGDSESAVAALREALRLDPRLAGAARRLARIQEQRVAGRAQTRRTEPED